MIIVDKDLIDYKECLVLLDAMVEEVRGDGQDRLVLARHYPVIPLATIYATIPNGLDFTLKTAKSPPLAFATKRSSRETATFLILGDVCTRRCHFCNVTHGKPGDVDESEPVRVAAAVRDMGLRYVVVTSVDRDVLAEFGARQFVKVCKAIKEKTEAKVELLTPDFKAKEELLERIIQAGADKLAHNIETVERLSKKIMPGCSYAESLKVLEHYAKSGIVTKSSIMVGLGEEWNEIERTLVDLRNVGVQQLTIGQYLSPPPLMLLWCATTVQKSSISSGSWRKA